MGGAGREQHLLDVLDAARGHSARCESAMGDWEMSVIEALSVLKDMHADRLVNLGFIEDTIKDFKVSSPLGGFAVDPLFKKVFGYDFDEVVYRVTAEEHLSESGSYRGTNPKRGLSNWFPRKGTMGVYHLSRQIADENGEWGLGYLVVYVGQSTNLEARMKAHSKDKEWHEWEFWPTPSFEAMCNKEAHDIDKFRPEYNRNAGVWL